MKNYFLSLWNDDRGQSTTEYILILSVVVMVAMKFKSAFQDRLLKVVENVGGQIESVSSQSQ